MSMYVMINVNTVFENIVRNSKCIYIERERSCLAGIFINVFSFVYTGNRIVNSTNITILGTTIPVRNGAIQDLNFTAIRSSQAGRYRCEADVYTTRYGNITLAGQFSLNVKRELSCNL